MKRYLILIILFSLVKPLCSQDNTEEIISEIYKNALTDSSAYQNLRYLCENTKGRISGSKAAEAAVDFIYREMLEMELDTVYLQPVIVPHWKRGDTEICKVHSSIGGRMQLNITALGLSKGTGQKGIKSNVLEVRSFAELDSLGTERVKDKIVFYNRPMDPTLINTFQAYGEAVEQRTRGASYASKYGASAVIVRSLSSSMDDYPHTGVMYYDESYPEIPAVAVSTLGAQNLSEWLRRDPDLTLYIETHCENLPPVISYNVIGEIRGAKEPQKIITVGGHLDAWDNSPGAHDDGSGCVQAIEVLRLFKESGIKPDKTLRAVMFMDEEIAQSGGKEYAGIAGKLGEQHVFALESDRGGLLPLGFGFSGEKERIDKMIGLKDYFQKYNLHIFKQGGGGADISPLKDIYGDIVLASFIPDWQRYFNYHHSANDSFSKVNYRELQLGSAAIASLIYLVDKFDY